MLARTRGRSLRIPAEWERHQACLMSWAVHAEWREWRMAAERELAGVIRAISAYEPVWLLTPRDKIPDAKARFSGRKVEVIEAPVDDIWMRDIAPILAFRRDKLVSIDFNFNAWGATRKPRAGDRLAGLGAAIFGWTSVRTSIVAEGGSFIGDGQGTIFTTESCLLNPNRNPSRTKSHIEDAFRAVGATSVIWLHGDEREPVTSGHIDGFLLLGPSSHVLAQVAVSRRDFQWQSGLLRLRTAGGVIGCAMSIHKILQPRTKYLLRSSLSAPCYVNAYIANGGVVAPAFGDPERDESARRIMTAVFPEHKIEMVRIDHIASGGGGIRCLTQPVPAV